MNRPQVLLADDHTFFLEAFTLLLKPKYEIVGTVTDGHALLSAARELTPDVIVMDISMPHLDGLEAAHRLTELMPEVKLIFLTMHEDSDHVNRALAAGASGYLSKRSAAHEIFQAIEEVLAGRTYVTPHLTDRIGDSEAGEGSAEKSTLRPRQREVLKLLAEGLTMKEVASILHLTPRTVAYHKYRIMEELGISTSAGLIQYAVKHGITE